MALNDLMRCVVAYTVFGEECFNTFWYRSTSNIIHSVSQEKDLCEAMELLFASELVDLLTTDTVFEYVSVWNYTDGVGFYSKNLAAYEGTVVSQTAPSQWCIGIKFGRPGIGWNYPRKRISGFPTYAYPNNSVDGGVAGALTPIANAWNNPNRFGSTFLNVIIRPDAGFGLGNPTLIAEGDVGGVVGIYDASQNSRRT